MSIRTLVRCTIGWASGLALVAAPAASSTQASGTFSLSGDRAEIYNIVGFVRIQAGRGSDVIVQIDVGGADADQLTVETGRIRGAETLRIIYPDDHIVYPELHRRSRSTISVRPDGTFFGRRSRGGDRVTVSGSGRGLEAYADLVISIPRGKTVGVYLGVGEVEVENVDGDLLVDVASAPVSARGTRGRLSIDTGSGSVEVTDARGDVNIDTGSGSVDVSDVSGGVLLIETGSGSVTGENLEVEGLNIDTGSGRIELRTVTSSDVRLDTGSGSVRVDLTTDVDVLDIDTGSGSVTVYIPDNFGAQLDIESSSGGIDFEMPVTVRRFSRQALRGSIGDGEGVVRVDTGSGSVRFLRR
ncbi:MAG: DUF4097 family beta strand repeat protein [Gemmatimonadetes bacterium]|nr:DUF4097 family beta strand repeat protein [Gemmatimonadota bacterium]